jgi:hypothetical protein
MLRVRASHIKAVVTVRASEAVMFESFEDPAGPSFRLAVLCLICKRTVMT